MASIHRKKNSPYWHCAFYLPDGRRTLRSTGTSDKRKAKDMCVEWERASREAKEGRLTEARARDTIATIYQLAHKEELPQSTTKDFLESWLKGKDLTLAESSAKEYHAAAHALLEHLGHKATKHMDTVTLRDLTTFRDALAQRVSGATVNKTLKILRGAWLRAVKDGVIRDNILVRLDMVKSDPAKRRAFTLPELQRILAASDNEWRGMVLCGVYLGQRIGDIARMTWRNVDLAEKEIRLITQKTKRPMTIPVHPVLLEYFESLPSADDLDAPIFPNAAATADKRAGTLSNQFYDIMAAAGLVEKRTHVSKDKGRDAKRDLCKLGFHALRHTATSLLKNAGVSDVVAREIIGHDSEAVSRLYTHIEKGSLVDAMQKLPDVTSATAKKGAK
ncbi:MAG: tyrosine-type recombinase/integrase [Verrucomicrobiia bacterium]|jgi:integrase